ncbi:hypothetical protein HDU84_000502 [Entophlyctis sp. JEL0112]|nr:hypothetical protein HDU84_000502 [Entophlyctis sp. JEL0112]
MPFAVIPKPTTNQQPPTHRPPAAAVAAAAAAARPTPAPVAASPASASPPMSAPAIGPLHPTPSSFPPSNPPPPRGSPARNSTPKSTTLPPPPHHSTILLPCPIYPAPVAAKVSGGLRCPFVRPGPAKLHENPMPTSTSTATDPAAPVADSSLVCGRLFDSSHSYKRCIAIGKAEECDPAFTNMQPKYEPYIFPVDPPPPADEIVKKVPPPADSSTNGQLRKGNTGSRIIRNSLPKAFKPQRQLLRNVESSRLKQSTLHSHILRKYLKATVPSLKACPFTKPHPRLQKHICPFVHERSSDCSYDRPQENFNNESIQCGAAFNLRFNLKVHYYAAHYDVYIQKYHPTILMDSTINEESILGISRKMATCPVCNIQTTPEDLNSHWILEHVDKALGGFDCEGRSLRGFDNDGGDCIDDDDEDDDNYNDHNLTTAGTPENDEAATEVRPSKSKKYKGITRDDLMILRVLGGRQWKHDEYDDDSSEREQDDEQKSLPAIRSYGDEVSNDRKIPKFEEIKLPGKSPLVSDGDDDILSDLSDGASVFAPSEPKTDGVREEESTTVTGLENFTDLSVGQCAAAGENLDQSLPTSELPDKGIQDSNSSNELLELSSSGLQNVSSSHIIKITPPNTDLLAPAKITIRIPKIPELPISTSPISVKVTNSNVPSIPGDEGQGRKIKILLPRRPSVTDVRMAEASEDEDSKASSCSSTATDAKEFLCRFCGREFKTKGGVRAHERLHAADSPLFVCEHCEKSFRRKQDLQRHAQLHQERSKSCVCEGCGFVFSRSDALLRHLQNRKCSKLLLK